MSKVNKNSEIWAEFLPLRAEVRKAADAKMDCDPESQQKWQDMRNHIVAQYYVLVRNTAQTMARRIRDLEEDQLASMGVDGLYDAIDGFEPSENVKFETYAVFRIRGSIIDSIRRADWVPRLVRNRAKKLYAVREKFETMMGRSATEEEMAKSMDMSLDEYKKLIDSAPLRQVQSLNTTYMGQDSGSGDEEMAMIDCLRDPSAPEPVDIAIQNELTSKLFGKNFTDTERKIIDMYYYEGRSMKDIAGIIGLSESRISQMMTAIISRIKEKIKRNPEYFGKQVLELLNG